MQVECFQATHGLITCKSFQEEPGLKNTVMGKGGEENTGWGNFLEFHSYKNKYLT